MECYGDFATLGFSLLTQVLETIIIVLTVNKVCEVPCISCFLKKCHLPFSGRFWFVLQEVASKINMAKNLFHDGANISFHFEASNLVACLAIAGKLWVYGLENGAPCKHFCFFPSNFPFNLVLLAFQSLLFMLKSSHQKHQENKSSLPKHACFCILCKTFLAEPFAYQWLIHPRLSLSH